jgi:hypothetical protein
MKGRLLRNVYLNMKLKMHSNALIPVFICFMALVTMSSALASESPDIRDTQYGNNSNSTSSLNTQVQPPQWDILARTTVFVGSGISDYDGGSLTMQEVDAGFSKKFSLNPRVELSTGLHYSLKNIDAPEDARLPTSLHRVSVNLGGSYRLNDDLTLGLMASPGLNGDFKVITSRDIRIPIGLHARYRVSQQLTLTGGVMYTIGNHELPVLPMIGAMYQPSEKWTFTLGFPRTGVMLKPNKATEYYLGAEFGGGEYRLHDSSIGANIISYRDYRAVTGIKWVLSPVIELGVAGGYSFGRKFVFQDGTRDDVDVHNTPFGRVELKFLW